MDSSACGIPELDRLLDGLIWNQLSRDEVARLEELLIADEAARNYYRDYLGLHVMLEASSTQVPSVCLPPLEETEAAPTAGAPLVDPALLDDNLNPWQAMIRPEPAGVLGFLGAILHAAYSSPRTTVMVLGGALAGYFIGLFALIPLARFAGETRPAVTENSTTARPASKLAQRGTEVGSLSTDRLARWKPEAAPIKPRVELGKRYELASGTADIALERGTRVVVQAPAAWNFDSDERLFLFSGRIAAHVPPAAIGFTVETPTASIIDLGTDFAVDVDGAGGTSLAVLRGRVEISKRASGAAASAGTGSVRLAAGEAMRISGPKAAARMIRPTRVDTSWAEQVLRNDTVPPAYIAYGAKPGTAGNQSYFHGALGLDFDVVRPIRVLRLGVFDDLGNGIDPQSDLTVELWSRNPGRLPIPDDDTGGEKLAALSFSGDHPGTLVAAHRFKSLAQPLDLPVGAYTIIASGFCEGNPNVNTGLPGDARVEFDDAEGAIEAVGKCRHNDKHSGEFPRTLDYATLKYLAGSFEYVPLDPKEFVKSPH